MFAGALVLLWATCAAGVSAEFWRVDTFEQVEKGGFHGTALLHDGRIVLSGGVEDLGAPEGQYVWAAVETRSGTVITTGTPGRVFRDDGDGWEELLAMETADFPAVAVSSDGDVYVGTAPGGEVYRIARDGTSELFFETGEGYIWCMDHSDEHGLVVGTGDTAAVYTVDEHGRGEVAYNPNDMSVSALAAIGDRVLAGTSIEGMLLDVTPGHDVRVLYDSPFEEVSGIVGGEDGTVCFAATTISMEDIMDLNGGYGSGFGEGAVYRIAGTGGAVELWRSRSAPVTSLGIAADGTLLAGLGAGGLVYTVSAGTPPGIAAGLDGEEVLSLKGDGDVLAATGGPGGVFRLGEGVGRNGFYESSAFNALSAATWGALTWDAATPSGSEVAVSVRSGNTADPDDTWSDWHEVDGDGSGPIECPPAQYLQWRADLTRGSGAVTPVLYSVEAAYVRENRAPLVRSVVVHESGDVVAGSAAGGDMSSASQTLPGGLEVSYSLDASAPSGRDLPVLLRGVRTASWEALDPNGDSLVFDLYLRSDDEDEWKRFEEGIRHRTLHTWDTSAMTDGTYRLRVTACDALSNPADLALEGSEVSQPFVVDHTPPSVEGVQVETVRDGLVVSGRAVDSASAIAFVDVSVDYGEWTAAFSVDGIYDSRSESFSARIDVVPGEHAVAVRAVDRHGNPTVVRKVVR